MVTKTLYSPIEGAEKQRENQVESKRVKGKQPYGCLLYWLFPFGEDTASEAKEKR
ncbi:hypothetical protein [Heyndrickxia acidicola]|uniref:Uncharacterized protein n=1 Tax=Heyndrickxia acidicola TaxID=209389 RepID=A0ABU6MFQ5_9BACI|nr:hypothetical protein [Heyndrickxia acidicola]MED1203501.1 hypothetical protein [Heyndrickxia acidicola]